MCLVDIYTATTCTKWAADKSSNGQVLWLYCGDKMVVMTREYMNVRYERQSNAEGGLIIIAILLTSRK